MSLFKMLSNLGMATWYSKRMSIFHFQIKVSEKSLDTFVQPIAELPNKL